MFSRIVINPLNLTDETRKLFLKFMRRRKDHGLFIRKDVTYWIGLKRIRFKCDMVVREKIPGLWRYDILSDTTCGKGKYGTTRAVIAVLKENFASKTLHTEYKYKRLYKLQNNAAIHEYELMRRCHHLAARALFPGLPSLISMRKFQGQLLNDVLNQDRRGIPLTINERYFKSIALLRALKSDMHLNLISHRDIKPDNIFYDEHTHKAYIFDLGISAYMGDYADTRSRGNATYSSPEDFISMKTGKPLNSFDYNNNIGIMSRSDHRSDLYTMWRVIGLLWRDGDPLFFNPHADHDQLMRQRIQSHWKPEFNLFRKIDSLFDWEKKGISALLRQMTAINPEDRLDIDTSIERLDQLYLMRKVIGLSPHDEHAFRTAHQSALSLAKQLEKFEVGSKLITSINSQFSKENFHPEVTVSYVQVILNRRLYKRNHLLAGEIELVRKMWGYDSGMLFSDFKDHLQQQLKLDRLMMLVSQAVNEIEDNPVMIREFIEILGLNCLGYCQNSDDIVMRTHRIISNFENELNNLLNAYEHYENQGNKMMTADLDRMLKSLYQQPINLDILADSTKHIQHKLQKLNLNLSKPGMAF